MLFGVFVSLYWKLQVSTYNHDIVFKSEKFFYLSTAQPVDPKPALTNNL